MSENDQFYTHAHKLCMINNKNLDILYFTFSLLFQFFVWVPLQTELINLSSVSTFRTDYEKWRLKLFVNETFIRFSRSQTAFYETSNWLMPHFVRFIQGLRMVSGDNKLLITPQVTTEIMGINGPLLFEK